MLIKNVLKKKREQEQDANMMLTVHSSKLVLMATVMILVATAVLLVQSAKQSITALFATVHQATLEMVTITVHQLDVQRMKNAPLRMCA